MLRRVILFDGASLAQLACVLCTCTAAFAQDLEPRRWTHLPVDTNVLAVGYAFTKSDLSFDPVLRIENADVELHTAVVSYSHYFGLFDTTARFDVHVPLQVGRWEGLVDSEPRTVKRDGLADPVLRLSANLCGAPALRGKEFLEHQQEHAINTSLGVALELRLPLGEYVDDKLINLGNNRFVVAPQFGVLHTHRDWSFELTSTTFFYTDNDEFFGGNELEQDPLFALQAHVVKVSDGGYWVAGGVAYGVGGESTIDGERKHDDKSNLLLGCSFGFRLWDTQGIRVSYVRGDSLTNVGADSHSVAVGWSIRF